jgi:hypothetical protein
MRVKKPAEISAVIVCKTLIPRGDIWIYFLVQVDDIGKQFFVFNNIKFSAAFKRFKPARPGLLVHGGKKYP